MLTEAPKTGKQEAPNGRVKQNTTHSKTTDQTLTQEEGMNVKLIKKIMSAKKTTLPSLRNEDEKRISAEKGTTNKLL